MRVEPVAARILFSEASARIGKHIVVNLHRAVSQFDEDRGTPVTDDNVPANSCVSINVVQPDAVCIIVADQVPLDQTVNKVMDFDAADFR